MRKTRRSGDASPWPSNGRGAISASGIFARLAAAKLVFGRA